MEIKGITGPLQVVAGQQYEYEAVGFDPDGSQVKYHIGTCYLCCHCVDDKELDSQPHTIIAIQVSKKK